MWNSEIKLVLKENVKHSIMREEFVKKSTKLISTHEHICIVHLGDMVLLNYDRPNKKLTTPKLCETAR